MDNEQTENLFARQEHNNLSHYGVQVEREKERERERERGQKTTPFTLFIDDDKCVLTHIHINNIINCHLCFDNILCSHTPSCYNIDQCAASVVTLYKIANLDFIFSQTGSLCYFYEHCICSILAIILRMMLVSFQSYNC